MKIQIAVAINENGDWCAFGSSDICDEDCRQEAMDNVPADGRMIMNVCYVEADVPLPKVEIIEGKVC